METGTAAARELPYKACATADLGDPGLGKWSSTAKLFVSDNAMRSTVDEYPVERMMRRQHHPDLRGHERDPALGDRPGYEVSVASCGAAATGQIA